MRNLDEKNKMLDISLERYIAQENSSLSSALEKIENNARGFLVILSSETVTGILTDGDVRRYLIDNKNIDGLTVADVCNTQFIYGYEDDPQEKLISLFDTKIKFLPIINSSKKLISIQFFDEMKRSDSDKKIRTRAPARITFGGGGSDKFDYFKARQGLCINAAIKKYAFCTVSRLPTYNGIKIVSSDYDAVWEFDDTKHLMNAKDARLLIYQKIAAFINLNESVTIHTHCDFPIGSGLGGSSSLSVAMLRAFAVLRGTNTPKLNLAKEAYKFERISMNISGGWQDQYVAAIGGVNAIHFTQDRHQVHNIRLSPEILNELQASLYLCYSGVSHNSSQIHRSIDLSAREKVLKMKRTVELANEMLSALTDGDLSQFDRNVNENWKLKSSYSEKITDSSLNEKIDYFRHSGASSAKILGAGGGGYFLVRVPAEADQYFRSKCKQRDIIPERVLFDSEGVVNW